MTLIDARTGAIHIGSITIEPSRSRDQVLQSPIGASLQQFDRFGDFFKLPHCIVEDHLLIVMLRFDENRIQWIGLRFSIPGRSWNDWSLTEEAERKRYQEQVAEACLGPSHYSKPNPLTGLMTGTLATIVGWRFAWGTVESKYERMVSDTHLYLYPSN